jgi:hypothetical protein
MSELGAGEKSYQLIKALCSAQRPVFAPFAVDMILRLGRTRWFKIVLIRLPPLNAAC